MTSTQKFSDASGNYTVIVEEDEVKLECYLMGSPTGGTGTECFHTVAAPRVSAFLTELDLQSLAELPLAANRFASNEWVEFHQTVMKYQTRAFVWSETDWKDSIDIKVKIVGEAVVGSELVAEASATYQGRILPFTYHWYKNGTIDGSYRLMESQGTSRYLIPDSDLGMYVRVGISSVDEIGFNSGFTPSKSVGPIVTSA